LRAVEAERGEGGLRGGFIGIFCMIYIYILGIDLGISDPFDL
jgi:hypothetical protein